MGDTIRDLLDQKKEIERKIKALQNRVDEVGCARVGRVHYPTAKPDRWYLSINVKNIGDERNATKFSFRSVVNADTRQQVIDSIPAIIADLQTLYKKVTTDAEN